jgi:hypothetical protein
MKKLIVLLSLFAITSVNSQTIKDKVDRFKYKLDTVLETYKTSTNNYSQIVHPKLQNNRLSEAFNQVIFGSSDLVDNASAFGISQNEKKTNVSVNTNFHLWGEAKNQLFIKAGINANGSGSVFNLYSRNEWKSSVGASIGFIYKFKGKTYSQEGKSLLDYNNIKRDMFIKDSIKKDLTVNFELKNYQDVRSKYTGLYKAMNNDHNIKYDKEQQVLLAKYYKDLKTIEVFFTRLEKNINKTDSLKRTLNFNKNEERILHLKFAIYNLKENENNDKIITYLLKKFWSVGNKELKKMVNEVAAKFDEKNIKNTGYSFHWFDFNTTFNNDTFGFSEKAENIKSEILEEFNAFDTTKTELNKLNTSLSLNYNYTRNKLEGAFYFQTGLKFNSGSFLTSNLINGTPKVSNKDANGLFIIKDDIGKETDQLVLGDFNAISENLKYGALSIYSAYYFGKKKIFGLNLGVTHRYRITTPKNTMYKNNYSILLGPIFRKPKKDDDTGLTFGIDVGYDNALYSANAKDNFVARVRVGIPLKLYNIKK